jgi:hypothetical protein
MIQYELKDNVVAHFPAIFKGLGSKPSVIHLALDVELLGGGGGAGGWGPADPLRQVFSPRPC